MEKQSKKAEFKKLRDEKLDLGILAKGGISLYYNLDVIDYDVQVLSSKGFKIIAFDDRIITTEKELHLDLQEKLGFPGYYGKGFDAMDDCMRDYEVISPGHVLVFKHLDHLDPRSIFHLLDVLALHSRRNIARGRKLLVLAQVDNPKFTVKEPLGALNFWLWNDQEWFEANRK
jgi:RNAse (barnase) inhibitor barstar